MKVTTVQDLVEALMEVDETKPIFIFIEGEIYEINMVDEIDDRVDINVKETLNDN